MAHIENDSAQTLVTTAETAIAFFPSGAVAPIPPGQAPPALIPTVIEGMFNILAGTGVTAITVRVRQAVAAGTLTGAVQSNANVHTIAAGASANVYFEAYDPVGSALGWVLTVAATGASGNSTVNTVSADSLPQ